MKHSLVHRVVYGVIACMFTVLAAGMAGLEVHAISAASCQAVQLPVALAPGWPNNRMLRGTLCEPATWAPGEHQVDVLVHGGTYNREYWDVPVSFPQYSYAEQTLQAGRATFAYDRLGSGVSSRPLIASVLTPQGDAYNVKQISQWLRNAKGYPQVNGVGHSLGSIVLMFAAGTYPNELDRVVLTGMLHTVGTQVFLNVPQLTPAISDPHFAGQGIIDATYLTTAPGSRGTLFYNATADPAVLTYDEAHKDMMSGSYFGKAISSIFVPPPLNVTHGITAPVLTVVGDQDNIGCVGIGALNCGDDAAIYANEAPYFHNAASLTTAHVDNTGHNLALHPTATSAFGIINQWLQSH